MSNHVARFHYCPLCRTELTDKIIFGRSRQTCPHCGWIYFLDPKVGAGVVIEKEGQILLTRRAVPPSLGMWCFPSGFMEINETPEQAAIRECKEETNLDVHLHGLFGVYGYQHDIRGAGVLILYRGEVIGGEPAPDDDVSEVRFFSPDSLPDDIAFISNREALSLWRNEKLLAQVEKRQDMTEGLE
jgi:8-oxo-dGTP diphosphatase